MALLRSLDADELGRFNAYAAPPTSGVGDRSRTFDESVARGERRPQWTWVAQRDGEVIARAAFWAPAGYSQPFNLDWFDPGVGPDRVEVGAALLRAAYDAVGPADYLLYLPADWRERPDAYADATDRITAAERAGLRLFVERLNLRWTSGDGLPPRSQRLTFGPATDDAVVADVLARVCTGTLDAYAHRDIERHGLRRAAELTIDEVAEMPGGRDWWRLAYDAAGELVGIVMPTRNSRSATIGYLGVVPGHRGHHYADDLVTEALQIFTGAGEAEANDATDVGNAPMAASFARVGYRVTGRLMIFS